MEFEVSKDVGLMIKSNQNKPIEYLSEIFYNAERIDFETKQSCHFRAVSIRCWCRLMINPERKCPYNAGELVLMRVSRDKIIDSIYRFYQVVEVIYTYNATAKNIFNYFSSLLHFFMAQAFVARQGVLVRNDIKAALSFKW